MTTGLLLINGVLPLLVLLPAWLAPSLSGPTLAFGVRVPAAHAAAPVIAEQRRAYRRWVTLGGAALVPLALALSAVVTGTVLRTVGPLAAVAVCLAGYLRANRAIRAVKQREDWYRGLRQAVVTDTTLRTRPEPFPWPWATPAALVLAISTALGIARYPSLPDRLPMHFDGPGHADRFAATSVGTAFAPVFAQAATLGLLLAVTWLAFRSRADLDPARPGITAHQHRGFIRRTAISVLLLTACANLSILAAAWQIWNGDRTLTLLPVIAPVTVGLALAIGVAVRTGRNGSRLAARPTPGTTEPKESDEVHQDDDRLWRAGGLFYVNRQDSAVFVPKRFGVGWTVNFGNPRSAGLAVLLIAFVVLMSLIGR
ncbi:DUF1648 domain-containing protein [Kitasatospora sp. NPDC052896]|uniref:DUF1648 domain-containing protein n=1 Tax=Kitasatospora sp. NPDC052896 TaxID=3364061 RepID=UPI0037C5F5DA